jgi:membrane peptidoglycan carboxypeptidase
MARAYRYRRNRVKRAASQRSRLVRSRWHWLLSVGMVAFLGGLVTVGVLGFLIYRTYAHDLLPPEDAIANSVIGTSIAYDRNGEYLYEYIDPLGGLQDPVPLEEISQHMIDATVSTEDASFYSNPGVNFKGLARAVMENVTPFGPGWFEGSGGSSITQQLVKNVYIEPEKRFDRRIERKVKETVIAVELKREYSDDEILGWYLNTIYYGNFAYGAEAAAQRYFSVHANALTLAQAAMLAGIPQAPGRYTPVESKNLKRAKARQREVLDLMVKHGYITQPEADEAAAEELTYSTPSFYIRAPHFVFYVEDQVRKMCEKGMFDTPGSLSCEKVVYQGGLRITTSVDMGLQRIGEEIVESIISSNEERYGGHNGALVALRAGTGEILTYVGSRDYFREDIEGQVDIVISEQSHGSSMKPFTYLTAFEQGWVPSTIVRDAPLELDVGGYQRAVSNWNKRYLGNITVRKALSESVNVAAVNTLMEVGITEYQRTAHRMGITDLRRNDCGPTITLGACEVKMLDQAYAYSVLANNGKMFGMPTVEDLPDGFRELDPVSVLRIEDANGNVLYEFEKPEERQVVGAEHAYMITDILSKEAINWSRLTFGWPAASKTGTSDEYRDNVLLGYTPGPDGLVVDVWMGNADNTPMAEGTFSSAGAGPIWKTFMERAHEYLEIANAQFEVPDGIVTASCGGRMEVFVEDEQPTKPGICWAPKPTSSGSEPTATPEPTPSVPRFPTRTIPTPTPTPGPTPTPAPTPEPTATPMPTPVPTEAPEVSPAPSPEPLDEGDGGNGDGSEPD